MTAKSLVVAKFEFKKTVRRKGFILGTLGLPLLLLVVMGLSLYAGAGIGSAATNQTTGYVDAAGFVQAAPGFVPYPTIEAGKAALVKGKCHSLLIVPSDYLATGTLTVYTMDNSLLGSTGASTAVQEFMTKNLLRHENVSDQTAQKILSPALPRLIVLDEAGNPKGDQELTGFILPFALTMVLALGILTSSGYLMQGIGEEKESRRGEFLLSHCSAEELLAGKILGYAGVSLLQIAGLGRDRSYRGRRKPACRHLLRAPGNLARVPRGHLLCSRVLPVLGLDRLHRVPCTIGERSPAGLGSLLDVCRLPADLPPVPPTGP